MFRVLYMFVGEMKTKLNMFESTKFILITYITSINIKANETAVVG